MLGLLITSLFVGSALLLPSVYFYRPEYFVALIGAVVGAISWQGRLLRLFSYELICLFLLAAAAGVSVFLQASVRESFVASDLMILLRYGFYGAAILTGAIVGHHYYKISPILIVTLVLAFGVVFSLVQYYDLLGLNRLLVPLYTPRNEELIIGESWRRVIGTLGNPNYWGLLIGTLSFYWLYRALWDSRWAWLPPLAVAAYGVVLTASRAAVISWVAGALLGGAAVSASGRRGPRFGAVVMVSIAIGAIGLAAAVRDYSTVLGFENVARWTRTETLDLRLRHWGKLLGDIPRGGHEAIIGRGPSKAEGPSFGDNLYILLLRDYGIVGLGLYLLLLIGMILRSVALMREASTDHRRDVAAVAMGLIALAVFDLSADGGFNVRYMSVVLFLYGMIRARALYHQQRVA